MACYQSYSSYSIDRFFFPQCYRILDEVKNYTIIKLIRFIKLLCCSRSICVDRKKNATTHS